MPTHGLHTQLSQQRTDRFQFGATTNYVTGHLLSEGLVVPAHF